ncbi:MAG: serine/threonine-protein kinase [Myxococcota bacterium]
MHLIKKGIDEAEGDRDLAPVPLVHLKRPGDTEVTPAVSPDPESLARLRARSEPPAASNETGSEQRLSRARAELSSTPGGDAAISLRKLVAADSTSIPAGQSHGSYELVESLASGGMGSVHLAVQRGARGFARIIAIKRIHPHLMQNQKFCEMFIDEARIASRINHGSVCRIFDFGEDPDGYFIAMEYLAGEPLSRVLRAVQERPELARSPRYPLIVARIVAGVAEGLHAAHSLCDDHGEPLGVVHRDVSPQNLFVLYDGTVRVTDFGIAQARQRLHHTHGGLLKGKLSYMAPEQIERKPLDARADLWSLGAVLWEALTMRRLFRGSSEAETLMRVMSKPVPPPSTLNPNVSPALDAIVRRALTRNPAARYGSARELARDLERLLASSGDTIPTMDLAEWLVDVFPDGIQRSSRRLKAALSSDRPGHSTATAPTVPDESIPPTSDSRSPPRAMDWQDAATLAKRSPVESGRTAVNRSGVSQRLRSSRQHLLVAACAMLLVPVCTWLIKGRGSSAPASALAATAARTLVLQPSAADKEAPPPQKIEPSVAPATTAAAVEPAPVARATPSATALRSSSPRLASVPSAARGVSPRPVENPPVENRSGSAMGAERFEMGTVFVNVSGRVADVYEGSVLLGRAPVRAALRAGAHHLTVRSLDGARQDLDVDVAAGAVALLNVKFLAP